MEIVKTGKVEIVKTGKVEIVETGKEELADDVNLVVRNTPIQTIIVEEGQTTSKNV